MPIVLEKVNLLTQEPNFLDISEILDQRSGSDLPRSRNSRNPYLTPLSVAGIGIGCRLLLLSNLMRGMLLVVKLLGLCLSVSQRDARIRLSVMFERAGVVRGG